jgi:hypothetical protein
LPIIYSEPEMRATAELGARNLQHMRIEREYQIVLRDRAQIVVLAYERPG